MAECRMEEKKELIFDEEHWLRCEQNRGNQPFMFDDLIRRKMIQDRRRIV